MHNSPYSFRLRKLFIVFAIYDDSTLFLVLAGSDGNPDAKRLYDDLLSDYNKLGK